MDSPGPSPLGNEYRGGEIIAATIVVTALSVIAVVLRLITRITLTRSLGWDDWSIIGAAFGVVIGAGLVFVQVHYGFGRHKYYLTEWQYIEYQKYSFGEWLQTFATLMFTKISICFFLLRITIHKSLIRPLQATIVLLIVSNIVLTLVWILQCSPVDAAWNMFKIGSCFSNAQLQRIIISQAIISIISDFVLAAIPILILRRVQISFRSKVGLCSLMGLGVITGMISLARTILNWQNVNNDVTWLSVDNWQLRSWEVCVGIVAACIPPLRPGYKHLVKIFHARLRSHNNNTSTPTSQKMTAALNSALVGIASPPRVRTTANTTTTTTTTTTTDGSDSTGSLPEHEIRKTTRIDVDRNASAGREGEVPFDELASWSLDLPKEGKRVEEMV
ncbi:MAG: hypothetical protein M1833_000991 [Piccolia ochrophora]|nr:MAG: hypothetical protein M1833_000991 [Piccolia ochrophora]